MRRLHARDARRGRCSAVGATNPSEILLDEAIASRLIWRPPLPLHPAAQLSSRRRDLCQVLPGASTTSGASAIGIGLGTGRLDPAVHVLPVADLHHEYQQSPVLDLVEDAVVATPKAIEVFVLGKSPRLAFP